MTVTCTWCGVSADDVPLNWTLERKGQRTDYLCERCSRENLRSIEGHLDVMHW